MDDRAELYWRMYQENCTQGRHHETQRAAVTTVLVSVVAAASAFMRPTSLPISKGYIPFANLVSAIGAFGAIVTRKQYERFAMHMRRASRYRNEIDKLYPGLILKALKQSADAAHKAELHGLQQARSDLVVDHSARGGCVGRVTDRSNGRHAICGVIDPFARAVSDGSIITNVNWRIRTGVCHGI